MGRKFLGEPVTTAYLLVPTITAEKSKSLQRLHAAGMSSQTNKLSSIINSDVYNPIQEYDFLRFCQGTDCQSSPEQ
jgi:hypothetical protein